MDEKTMVNDILEGVKSGLKTYQGVISEAENMQLRQTIKQWWKFSIWIVQSSTNKRLLQTSTISNTNRNTNSKKWIAIKSKHISNAQKEMCFFVV